MNMSQLYRPVYNASHGMIRTAMADTVTGRGTRRFLAGILAIIALASAPLPALANGGAGGKGEYSQTAGGSGGTTSATGAGGSGGTGTMYSSTTGGGGGGGAGSTGGAGGVRNNNGTADAGGGAGGATAGASGANGLDGVSLWISGGGGGGGAHGEVLTTTTTDTGATGGNGGKGGIGGDRSGGGGGGAGGYGVVIDGSGLTYTNTGTVAGGAGGAGGVGGTGGSSTQGGSGGDGGYGVYFTGSDTLNNSGSITGGNGGAGGAPGSGSTLSGSVGGGGVGVVSTGNSTITNSGTITGGKANGGTGTQADAIDLSGGGNTLILESGSTINGNVVSTSGTTNGGDTFALGGSTNSSFNIDHVGSGQQYQGFNALKETGSATWTITGSNTSGHGWNLDGGTLSISSGTGAELGNYTLSFNGGTLLTTSAATLSQNMSLSGNGSFDNGSKNDTLSGVISGTGAMSFAGAGTTTLSGANTYTGATTISAGTLKVSGSLSDSSAVSVSSGATYQLGASDTVGSIAGAGSVNLGSYALTAGGDNTSTTMSGVISGTGGLTKSGTGTLTLDGANTYTGTTTVSAGTLEVGDASHTSASLASAVTVGSGGTLRGHGTINGDVTNGGTVYPGGSIGTLTISGNYTQSSAGTLSIGTTTSAVAGTGYDQLLVSGTAALAGKLNVNVGSGTYKVGTKYDIVHAGKLSGQFDTVTYNPAFASYLNSELSYTGTDAYMTLHGNSAAFTSAQGTSTNDWNSELGLLSGEQAVMNVQGGTAGSIMEVNGKPDPAVWVRGLIGTGNAYGAGINNNGVLIGYGDEVRPGLILGVALGSTGMRTSSSSSTSSDLVKTHANGVYLYSQYNRGPIFIDATATAGGMNTSSSRNLTSTGDIASGSASGSYAGVSAQAGYRITKGKAFVTPYVGAGFLHTHRSAYNETGAGTLNLSYAAANDNIETFRTGARIGADFDESDSVVVSPWVELGAIAYTGDRNKGLTVTLGSQTDVLPATGAPSTAASANAGIAVMSHANWSAQLVYHGQFSKHTHMHTGDVKIVYRW